MSDHFDGAHYRNPLTRPKGLVDVLYWLLTRRPPAWPKHIPIQTQKMKHKRVPQGELWVTFIGHSSFLIQMDGLNILTDPVWSERASPLKWAGPKRVVVPGVAFEDLPPIDVVLISHNHYDHMDMPTLKQLEVEHQPRFVVSKGNRAYLEKRGVGRAKGVVELDWMSALPISERVHLYSVPAQHFSSRSLFDRNKTSWCGFYLQGSRRVYFAGDTGYGPHFQAIRENLGAPDLALLPIGAFKPEWFMHPVHMSPCEAVKAAKVLEAKLSIGMHFGTFQLADEMFDEPLLELQKALKDEPGIRFWTLNYGESKKIE